MVNIQIGIVGTGNFGYHHGAILSQMDGVQIRSICGTSLDKAEKLAAKFDGAKGYSHVEDMLDANELDAVYICVPPGAHGEIERELVHRSIPFFVEKPLGVDLETPRNLLTAIQQKSLITSVGYHFRYTESVQLVKKMMSGCTSGITLGQWMGTMPGVDWWKNQRKSGGQFIEQTTHIVDLLRYVCGEIDEVYAMFGTSATAEKDPSITVADVGTVNMKLKNGTVANIANTCLLPPHMSRTGMTFYTDQGTIDWSPSRLDVNFEGTQSKFVDSMNPYQTESEAFLHAVRTGDSSRILSDYHDAYQTHRVTCAALESATKGIPIILRDDEG